MTFAITYPESAFVALGGNQVRRGKLRQAILATPAITDVLEDIRPSNYGSGSPDTESSTGRVWGFYFAGAGPSMAGAGQAALDAIVATHDGAHVEPESPASGGSPGQVWTRKPDGSAGWATPVGGGGGPTTPETTVIGRIPAFGDTAGDSLAQSRLATNNNGQLQINATTSETAEVINLVNSHSVPMGLFFCPQGLGGTITDITTDVDGLALHQGALWVNDKSRWSSQRAWFKPAPIRGLYGFNLTRAANSVSITRGWLVDASMYAHDVAIQSISTAITGNVGGLDTGSFATNTWYYIYVICNNARVYNVVCSVSNTAPTLSASNFTTTDYRVLARIGSFRTTSSATTVAKFSQVGSGSRKTYYVDDATAFLVNASAITSTTYATFGSSGNSGSLPKTAIQCTMRCTCNSSSGLQLRPDASSGIQDASRPSALGDAITGACPAGTFQLANAVSAGSSTAVMVAYDEEVMG